ncbi:inactive pancreatic lipase-related protein 1-like [Dreissena polymorpha]|uniref:inactive pancreatic lipase-related protein 1-like n=1 Tax=Dreissena polymorpha TaxID=45954 RepID=UPI002264CC5F|nr:inactive pancreatic lipase-related protein 1-like [Dreissena polymorpha]
MRIANMILPTLLLCQISTLTALFWSNKVCYKNVGCFENSNPFDNTLGQLPDSPDNIKVKVYLWTRENPEIASQLFYDNTQSIADSNFDASRPTKILIHGFMSSKDEPVIANLSVALIKQGDYNIIGIDWSAGSRQFYPKAVSNTRVVGAIVSRLVQTLQTDFSLKLSDLHIIGHSLGAHTAGYIGRRVPGIAHITGKLFFLIIYLFSLLTVVS